MSWFQECGWAPCQSVVYATMHEDLEQKCRDEGWIHNNGRWYCCRDCVPTYHPMPADNEIGKDIFEYKARSATYHELFCDNDKTVACSCLTSPLDPDHGWGDNSVCLYQVHTRKPYRRRGLARTMMLDVIDFMSTCDIVITPAPYLDEPMSREALVKFYLSLGFKWHDDTNMILKSGD